MIFIIGGRGFVGSAFARYCEQHQLEYAIIDRANYRHHVGRSCDVLINANGNSRKFLAKESPLEEFDASVRSVRSSLKDFEAKRYVYLSTCDVYPDCSSPATTREESRLDPATQSAYGFHKYLAEQCVRHSAPSWLIIRLGGFVGPGLKKNPIHDILHGGPLWLDLASELQYLHTDVAAEIVFDLIRRNLSGEIFNLCGQGTIQLSEITRALRITVPVQPGSPRVRYDVSIEKLSTMLPIPESRSTVLRFVTEANKPTS